MELLMILLDRGRMSDYSDSSTGFGSVIVILLFIIVFILSAIVARWREKHK